MVCPNCAKDVENDAKFCGFCGYKLENEGKKASIIEEKQPEKMDDALLIKSQQTEKEKKCFTCGAKNTPLRLDAGEYYCRGCYPRLFPKQTPQESEQNSGAATKVKEMEYAGFWNRFVANFYDNIITLVILIPVIFIIGVFVDVDEKQLTLIVILFDWVYSAGFESSKKKATIGKQAMGIIVTDKDGNRISFIKATIRFFSKFISLITLYIGFIIIGFTKKKQGLHDIIAGCLVLKERI